MSYLVFDGDELLLSLFDSNGRLVNRWPAGNFGGPTSDFKTIAGDEYITFIPDGEYSFDRHSQSIPQRHKKQSDDAANGPYGSLGIFRLEPFVYGGQLHSGVGIHSGRETKFDSRVISQKPLLQTHNRGPYYRTFGCIRTTDAAMLGIAGAIKNDPLKTLKVRNNGSHPVGKLKGGAPQRLL